LSENPTIIKFFTSVNEVTVNALMDVIDQRMNQGVTHFKLLISCPGGSAFLGLSAYNYLKGLPVKVTTHNFGSVDSIGVVLYCGGSHRLSVPQARFLLHGVSINFQNANLEEKQLEEKMKGLRIDVENIAKVIAASSNKESSKVKSAMEDRTTLTPQEAQAWGLVHEIRSELFEAGDQVVSIH
jgi:ATP-dependent protease ClpP protease subunit